MKSAFLFSLLTSAALGLAAPAFAQEPAAPAAAKAEAPKAAETAKTEPAKPAEPAKAEAPKADAAKPAEKSGKDYVIIKLDNEEIRLSEVEDIWKSLFPGGNAPDFNGFDENIRQNVLRGLISERLIHKEALKEGFDKSEEVQKRLAQLQKQVVMQAFMENKSKALVTEQQLRTAYAEKAAKIKEKGEEEVKARHILVTTEEEAKELAKNLKKGGDFAKIAKEKSLDKPSGENGGDLGYFTKEKMVPEFAEAAFKLKKGDTSEPVKTQFGWHIIQVEDRRKVEVPSFESMQEGLKNELTNKALQDYVEGLLNKSTITYYGEDGKTRDFSKSLATAAPAAAPAAKPAE